jgi:hypothetical protein
MPAIAMSAAQSCLIDKFFFIVVSLIQAIITMTHTILIRLT